VYRLGWCPEIEGEHACSRRQYAHVFHLPNQVCLAREFSQLPERYRLGILMHELGHILIGPEGAEYDANRAAQQLGIQIRYQSSQFGRDVETIDRRDFKRARTILAQEFF